MQIYKIEKAWMCNLKLKVMLIVLFDIKVVIMIESKITIKIRERVGKKWQDLKKDKSWIMHRDNAKVHDVLSLRQFLVKKRIPTLEHPPYS